MKLHLKQLLQIKVLYYRYYNKKPNVVSLASPCAYAYLYIERVSSTQMILLKSKKIIVNFLREKMVFSRVIWFMIEL